MMKDPQISVIVPVFNVETYLPRCIESILAQTFTDFELLLIDDGSPDASGIICDEYAAKDGRVRVFHKENGGVSSARNVGLDQARGTWIAFVDADDWIDKETLEACYPSDSSVDFVRFGFRYVFRDGSLVENDRLNEQWSQDEFLTKVLSRQTMVGVWGGLFRRAIFLSNNICFNSKFSLGEDWLVLVQYLKEINTVKILNTPLYNYNRQNEVSLTSYLSVKKIYELNEVASIICYDPDLGLRVGTDYRAPLKTSICALCLANLMLQKSKPTVYLEILREMVCKDLYPTIVEILRSQLAGRFKLLLAFFVPISLCLRLLNLNR